MQIFHWTQLLGRYVNTAITSLLVQEHEYHEGFHYVKAKKFSCNQNITYTVTLGLFFLLKNMHDLIFKKQYSNYNFTSWKLHEVFYFETQIFLRSI